MWTQHFDRRCLCHHTVRECGSLSLTNCAGYDKLLFHEWYTSVPFAVSLPPPKVFKLKFRDTRVGTLIVVTIYLQLIQNRYMFQSFTVLQCSHQHCVQPVASDVEVVEYL